MKGHIMGCVQSNIKNQLYLDEKLITLATSKPSLENRPELTEEYKRIVRETWNIIKLDISKIGVVMFMRLFERYPDVQQLFVPFRGLSQDELRSNKRLREHGLRVLSSIEKCIARIDELDRLEKMLYELGKKHVIIDIKVEYLELLIPQLQQAIMPVLGENWTYLVESAWSAFLKYIIHIMAEAMAQNKIL